MSVSEFESKWQTIIKNGLLKSFPTDFLTNEPCEFLKLPGKPLVKGSELFGSFEIIDTSGVPLLNTESVFKIKYILYANRTNPDGINIPINEDDIKSIVKNYEIQLDNIVKTIENDFKTYFPESDQFVSTSSRIFQVLNLSRH